MRIVGLVVLLTCTVATADTTPLSALPSRPRRIDLHDVPVPPLVYEEHSNEYATVAAPYCSDGDPWHHNAMIETHDTFAIGRLVTLDDGAEFERTVVQRTALVDVALERQHIPLAVVARSHDLVVYAYRSGDRVFLLTEGKAMVRIDTPEVDLSSGLGTSRDQDCDYSLTQLDVVHGNSQTVQISGAGYLVTASVTKTRRDREPLVSVRIRN